ncbi:MAG: thioredoxin [Pseudomonadota bacterium]|nr:thioredoxin [Pseudomonadota bacterium]
METTSDLIKDSDTRQFSADVIEESQSSPVVVDFWAPWCGPCKQLTPTIEKLIKEYGGKIKLVKINVDENQELAAQMRVQSIPMVVAFKGGKPVDGFAGALPESQLRQFFEKLTDNEGSPVEQALLEAGAILEDGDFALARELFSEIVGQDPKNALAHAGIARCIIAEGDNETAKNYIAELETEITNNTEIKSILSAIELAQASKDTDETDTIRQRLQQNPSDPDLRYELAVALYGEGNTEEAIDILVELVKTHKNWKEEAARTQLLKIFDALGYSNPIAVEGRRALSAVLFS